MFPRGMFAFWKPAARSRAARWCSCLEARSICRSRSAMRCMSRRASCRPMAIRDWRPTIGSSASGAGLHSSATGAVSRHCHRRTLGRSHPQSGLRAFVQAFSRGTKWKPASPITPCLWFSIPKACEVHRGLGPVAGQLIQILHREVPSRRNSTQLLDEIMAYPGLPAEWRLPRNPAGIVASDDDAATQGRPSSRFLFHLYDACDADRRRAAKN